MRLTSSLFVARGLLSCGMGTLSCGIHVGSSSLTRDRTPVPCTGSVESYSLRHQCSPSYCSLKVGMCIFNVDHAKMPSQKNGTDSHSYQQCITVTSPTLISISIINLINHETTSYSLLAPHHQALCLTHSYSASARCTTGVVNISMNVANTY